MKKGKIRYLLIVLVLIISVVSFIYLRTLIPSRYDVPLPMVTMPKESADAKELGGISSDEALDKALQRANNSSYYLAQVNQTVSVTKTGMATLEVVNAEENAYPISVDLYLGTEGTLLYQSGAIYPCQYIDEVQLHHILKVGTYAATVKIYVYDADTKEMQAQMEVFVTIVVE